MGKMVHKEITHTAGDEENSFSSLRKKNQAYALKRLKYAQGDGFAAHVVAKHVAL